MSQEFATGYYSVAVNVVLTLTHSLRTMNFSMSRDSLFLNNQIKTLRVLLTSTMCIIFLVDFNLPDIIILVGIASIIKLLLLLYSLSFPVI
jgi:hypothetical protein